MVHPAPAAEKAFEVTTSRQFTPWLAEQGAALMVSTYQAGMVLVVGIDPQTGKLWLFNRHFERAMGLAVSGGRMALAGLYQVTEFRDANTGPGERLFVPQAQSITGDVDAHDIAFDGEGRTVFANTLFSCLARTSDTHSFEPIWQPPFISRLAAEDRCHLNGLAMKDGAPATVSCVAATDVADGWRDRRRDGGILVDVASGETVVAGLSMPHSPRWHEGRLWLLNAGTGEFGTVDTARGAFEPIAFLPGFGRGLAFLGGYALAATSEARENRTFAGLALNERLTAEGMAARCGLHVIDLATGDVVHWLRIEGVINELFDVAVVPEARQPQIIGFKSDEVRRTISLPR